MDASQLLRLRKQQQTTYLARAQVRTAGDHTTVQAAQATAGYFLPTNAHRANEADANCCRVFAGQGGGAVTPVRPLACDSGICERPTGYIARPGCCGGL